MIALKPAQTRVLSTIEAATEDAQRFSQAATTLANKTSEAVNAINDSPFGAGGQLLTNPGPAGTRTTDLALVLGSNIIGHTLGRPPNGFAIVDLHTVAATIRRVPRARSIDAQSIELVTSAACGAKIWVW